MGEAVLSAFLQALFQAIADLLKKELLQLGNDFEAKRKRLASNVPMIQAVLNGAGKTPLSDRQKIWLIDVKDIGYRTADFLDECYCEERRCEVITHFPSARNNKAISYVNLKRRKFWGRKKKDMEEIESSMENLAKQRSIFQIDSNGGCEGSCHYQSSSFPPVFVHGRQDDRDKIVKLLLQSDLKRNVEILPILGEAYIGKTTLAQLVMNDERVSRHFDRRLWVHVSRDFNIERITISILESLGGGPFHPNNFNTLQTNLKGQLQGRRFLLVLDDCWEENWHNWEKLQHPLLNGAVGSKIIVTTRSRAVVTGLGTSAFHQLRSLPDEACWLLFGQYAIGTDFSGIQACSSGDSLDCSLIKEEVIRKCKGVPFIAASLGHKVHLEDDRSKWASILQGEDWDSNSDDFDRALQLSYEQLDSHLKPCFAYSSAIPQKFQFEEEWLIQLWMAQGFIQPKPNSHEAMEDIGGSYFRTLVGRSFFQRAHIAGEQRSYSLSWMMHNLALRVSAEECYTMEGSCNLPEKIRHLTVVFNSEIANNLFEKISRSKSLHTLIIMGGSADYSLNIPDDLGVRFARLQALDFSNFGISDLPESIGKLKHLRCLQLRGTKIGWLPKSICSLYNLQTLGLRDCYHLRELPSKISNLSKLRHIDLAMTRNPCQYICSLRCMTEGIGSLTDLQTLSRFVISQRRTHKTDIAELASLNNLHGQLIISNLHLVKDAEEASQACLASKKFLKKLELSWGDNGRQPEQILERLNPPSSIKELTISDYAGIACPGWLGYPGYTNLVTVRLYDFKSCKVAPPLGQLPCLENLHLKGWDGLISMNCSEFCGCGTATFQSLKKLHLERLDNFRIWDGEEKCALPALLELVVENCSKLEQITHDLPSLTKITVEGSLKFYGLRNFPSVKYVNVIASGEWIWESWRSLSSPISITLCALPTVQLPSGLGTTHTSLQCLEISHCEFLEYIPEDWPPRNLNHFSVKHCSQLRELPSGIRHLQALEDIEIIDCPGLNRLPDMDGLTSLLRLEISHCDSIHCLPRLPSSVQFLSINDCPQLSLSCRNNHSADHAKINQIFSVWIDSDQVFTSADEPRFVIPAMLQRG